jgi:hypothetical protein
VGVTPADIATLVDAAPLPPGYTLQVEPQRKHLYRSLWSVRVFRDGERIWGRAYYNPALGIAAAQKVAWVSAGAGA